LHGGAAESNSRGCERISVGREDVTFEPSRDLLGRRVDNEATCENK
jgi:hypothetical protein